MRAREARSGSLAQPSGYPPFFCFGYVRELDEGLVPGVAAPSSSAVYLLVVISTTIIERIQPSELTTGFSI